MSSVHEHDPDIELGTDEVEIKESTLRLKNSLKISELSKGTGFTFEVEPDEEADIPDLEVLETGEAPGQHYMKTYIQEDNTKSQALVNAITPDERVGDFQDVIPQMSNLTSDGKIKKVIVRPGTSKELVHADGKVMYHYEVYAEGKEGPIDSSLVRRFPNTLVLATGGCIHGLFIGLQSMRVGEIAKFWFHFDYAYKAMGIPPRIPPRANVLCIVEVLSTVQNEARQDIFQMTADDRRDLPFEIILATAKDLKEGGNVRYEKKDYQAAIARYRKGIELLDNYPVALMTQEELRSDLLGALYSNLAQAYLKVKDGAKACTAAKCGLRIPKYRLKYKLFFKFAKGKGLLKEYDDSVDLCRKALGCLTAEQKEEKTEILAYMEEMKQRSKIQEEGLRGMYEKMLNNDKDKEEEEGSRSSEGDEEN